VITILLDKFYRLRKAAVCALAYLAIRFYGVENISWRDAWDETYAANRSSPLDLGNATDLDDLLKIAKECKEDAERRRTAITDKCKTFLTIGALFVALCGLIVPDAIDLSNVWARVIFLLAGFLLVVSILLLLMFIGIRTDTQISLAQEDIGLSSDDRKKQFIKDHMRCKADVDCMSDFLADLYRTTRFCFVFAMILVLILMLCRYSGIFGLSIGVATSAGGTAPAASPSASPLPATSSFFTQLFFVVLAAFLGWVASPTLHLVKLLFLGPHLRLDHTDDPQCAVETKDILDRGSGIEPLILAARYFRISVENTKRRPARNCRAYLTEVHRHDGKKWVTMPYHDTMPLNWSYHRDDDAVTGVVIPRGPRYHVDVAKTVKNRDVLVLLTKPEAVRYADLLRSTGVYRLTVQVSADEMASQERSICIWFDHHKWDAARIVTEEEAVRLSSSQEAHKAGAATERSNEA